MPWDDDTKKTFDDLVAELVDGSLNDERRQLLGEMVGAHREARELYVDFCQLQAQLLEQHGALGNSGKPVGGAAAPKPKAFPVGVWLALVVAMRTASRPAARTLPPCRRCTTSTRGTLLQAVAGTGAAAAAAAAMVAVLAVA